MPQALRPTVHNSDLNGLLVATPKKPNVATLIEEAGVIPVLRVKTMEAALYIAGSLVEAGLPVLEIAMNVPDGLRIVAHVAREIPKAIVGAGGITSAAMARECVESGAQFLSSDAMVPGMIELAKNENVPVVPGAFTPTEAIAAWNAGADFVKVVPCNAAGGASYIRSLKSAFPDVRLIAAGGVTQQTALGLVASGATALCVGRDLIPADAIRLRQTARIRELARRFLNFVDNGRIEAAGHESA